MELDEQPRPARETNGSKSTGRNTQYDHLLTEAMEYGQELQRDYRDSPDGEQGKALLDIFSLVAYDNPRESVHGSLLDRKGRVAVAEELNSAILGEVIPCQSLLNSSNSATSFPWPVASCRARKDVPPDRGSR